MKAMAIGLCAAMLFLGKVKDEKQKAFLEQDVKNGLTEMIIQLKTGQHRSFMNRHLSQGTRLYLKRKKQYDNAVKDFTEKKAAKLLVMLEKAMTLQPEIDVKQGTVTYRENPYDKPLVLIRSQKQWYVLN